MSLHREAGSQSSLSSVTCRCSLVALALGLLYKWVLMDAEVCVE